MPLSKNALEINFLWLFKSTVKGQIQKFPWLCKCATLFVCL